MGTPAMGILDIIIPVTTIPRPACRSTSDCLDFITADHFMAPDFLDIQGIIEGNKIRRASDSISNSSARYRVWFYF
jgi:hypothetical protein